MLSSLYIFFCAVSLIFVIISLYDWAATRNKGAIIPTLLTFALSIMCFAFSWNVTTYDVNGTSLPVMTNTETYAVALFWFIPVAISLLLALTILLETPRRLLTND